MRYNGSNVEIEYFLRKGSQVSNHSQRRRQWIRKAKKGKIFSSPSARPWQPSMCSEAGAHGAAA